MRGGAGLGGIGLGGGRVMRSPVLVSDIDAVVIRRTYLVVVSVVEAAMAQVARAAARRKFSFMLKD